MTNGIDVRVDTRSLQELAAELDRLSKRGGQFAMRRATNTIAFRIRDEWRQQAAQNFDRPTRFTLNAALVQRAGDHTDRSGRGFHGTGTESARVFMRDESAGIAPDVYLQQQVLGGARRMKRSERALQSRGFLPSGWRMVPGQGIRLDAHGNMPGGQVQRILSALRASPDPGQNQTERSRSRRGKSAPVIFALPAAHGRLLPGVYERRGRQVKPLLIFVRSTRYTPRLPIWSYARGLMEREGPPEMRRQVLAEIERALERAARKART